MNEELGGIPPDQPAAVCLRGSNPTWTPPVIADGKLYVREEDTVYCFSIKRPNR